MEWTFIAVCVVIVLFLYLWWMVQSLMVEVQTLAKQCRTDYVDWNFFETYMETLQKAND